MTGALLLAGLARGLRNGPKQRKGPDEQGRGDPEQVRRPERERGGSHPQTADDRADRGAAPDERDESLGLSPGQEIPRVVPRVREHEDLDRREPEIDDEG